MPETAHKITSANILSVREYDQQRDNLKKKLLPMKKLRRVEVGPFATFYFENYATMWLQLLYMLRIEMCCEEQLAGELEAYNTLIPQGDELIATSDAGNRGCDPPQSHSADPGRDRRNRVHGNRRRYRQGDAHLNMTTAPPPTVRPHRCIGCASSSARTRSRASPGSAWSSASPMRITRPYGGAERRDQGGAGERFCLAPRCPRLTISRGLPRSRHGSPASVFHNCR